MNLECGENGKNGKNRKKSGACRPRRTCEKRSAQCLSGTIPNMDTRHIPGEAAMVQEAERFAGMLTPLPDRATVVALSGELGGGKTTFVRAIARFFGAEEAITSPTFVIQKTYPLSDAAVGFERLIHIDAYRLQNPDEMKTLRWEEVLADPKNLVFVEWPERIESLLPPETIRLSFDIGDGPERFISYHEAQG